MDLPPSPSAGWPEAVHDVKEGLGTPKPNPETRSFSPSREKVRGPEGHRRSDEPPARSGGPGTSIAEGGVEPQQETPHAAEGAADEAIPRPLLARPSTSDRAYQWITSSSA